MPSTSRRRLRWIPEKVAKEMRRNNIRSRHHLAQVATVGRATVYASFDEDWSGNATEKMMAQLVDLFDVNVGTLVTISDEERKPGPSGKKAS